MDAWKQKLFNTLAPTGTIWNGHNASGWKSDIVAANGFDIRMQYGGQDRELGERLFNAGIKSKRIRYSAVCVHLDRSRGFTPQESKDKNHAIRDNAKNNKVVRTDYGITELRSN